MFSRGGLVNREINEGRFQKRRLQTVFLPMLEEIAGLSSGPKGGLPIEASGGGGIWFQMTVSPFFCPDSDKHPPAESNPTSAGDVSVIPAVSKSSESG
jgi:hypothetical protein